MIKISVNGDIKEIEEDLTVYKLIELLGYTTQGFAVAINTVFIAIANYDKTIVKHGDTIDILSPVQGG